MLNRDIFKKLLKAEMEHAKKVRQELESSERYDLGSSLHDIASWDKTGNIDFDSRVMEKMRARDLVDG